MGILWAHLGAIECVVLINAPTAHLEHPTGIGIDNPKEVNLLGFQEMTLYTRASPILLSGKSICFEEVPLETVR